MAVSGDGLSIHGLTDDVRFVYYVQSRTFSVRRYIATPPLGPRLVSVSQDGLLDVTGWSVRNLRRYLTYDFQNVSGSLA